MRLYGPSRTTTPERRTGRRGETSGPPESSIPIGTDGSPRDPNIVRHPYGEGDSPGRYTARPLGVSDTRTSGVRPLWSRPPVGEGFPYPRSERESHTTGLPLDSRPGPKDDTWTPPHPSRRNLSVGCDLRDHLANHRHLRTDNPNRPTVGGHRRGYK